MSEPSSPAPAAAAPVQPEVENIPAAPDREALVNDIVSELRKDALKEAALARLKQPRDRERWGKFFQHPAALLVLSFVFTGIIGFGITYVVQKQEWERQQRRLARIRAADVKYAIIDDLSKTVVARNVAARRVVDPLMGPEREGQLRLLKVNSAERLNGWLKAVYDWRYNSQLLRPKLKAHIKNAEIGRDFDEIIKSGNEINDDVIVLQLHLNTNNWTMDKTAEDLLDKVDTALEVTATHLDILINKIVADAEAGITSENP